MPDIQLAEKKTVLQILESFKGTGPLRELLAQLNYDPLNEPVSRKEWPEPAQVALAQDPRLYGRAAGEFYVVYAQLAAEKLKLTDERTVIPQLLKQYPYALFVFSDKTQTNFHFVNVKWENNQKRRLYRRITIGPQERMRTAAERLSMLDIQTIDAGLFGVTAQNIQDRHDEAFDVAKVSKSFFDEYKRVFEVMRDAVKGFGTSDEEQDRRHLFTQRLFNRLMFLRFIQKKGWLTIDGSTDYLAALWASHGKLKQDGKNFYTDRLRLLFAALNNERAGIVLQGGGGAVEATIGKVKYLNGGLFEETDEDKDSKVRITDDPFKQIFDKADGLFEAFNFTITESTPLDVEIAVDPEMLGKIFEELVTGRHDSGSYYTPKPVVSFMCREALKGYLAKSVSAEQSSALERFVDRHEPDDIHDAEAVLNALRTVTVCDPACGSGAYLLGMMHELLDLRQCLFQTRHVDQKTMYQRKLDIIQTNIYGVDIAEFAVNIARLRLWLSLAVDFDGPAPEPLPNLDYKIEVGDSISSPSPKALQMGLQQPLVDQFLELKRKYLVAHHAEKQTLRSQVETLRHDIMVFSNRKTEGFDWVIDFAEVFVEGGFSIVLANPPYVRLQELSRVSPELLPHLKKNFISAKKGNYDLYVVFVERGLQLLKPLGEFAYILPHKFFNAQYGEPLRGLLSDGRHLQHIVHFGDLQVFSAATSYVCLLFLSKKPVDECKWETVADIEKWSALGHGISTQIAYSRFSSQPWNFDISASASLFERLQSMPDKLASVAAGMAQGLRTSANEVYVLRVLNQNRVKVTASSKELEREVTLEKKATQRFLQGRNIRPYEIEATEKIVIVPYSVDSRGIELISPARYKELFPKTWAYLKENKAVLCQREDGKMDRPDWYAYVYPKNIDLMSRPKLLVPDIAARASFAYDEHGTFAFGGGYGITLRQSVEESPKYFLALLNSSLLDFYWRRISTPLRGGFFRYFTQFLSELPIRRIDMNSASERKEHDSLVSLADRLIEAKATHDNADTSELEEEVNEIVFRLYSLTPSEVAQLRNSTSVLTEVGA
ncbi:Eco57I restriction-modification methylase [Granulicella rosea]|uniref:site-specific DNA-methyltransferase (adenine-specific) n=1 Tax=Granulicella rosea TaxID=474952 RepID=A0A239GMW5_9BACT|nr:TaqI-like C-terminal specificity domain-containing protein [Granulicella rosea]SNS70470.1 Eco57I restriction-modification methylase [Granulicella rosea]